MATRAEEFEALYQVERGRLARSTVRIAGDRADDIVHDAFLTFLTHGSNVTFPKAWLGRVARNRALNDVRRAREVPLTHDIGDEPTTPDAERDAVRAVVAAALEDLDERSRHALLLRFFEERDYPEIAESLGVRLQQAHVVLHRSLRRLGRAIVRRLAEAHGAGECVPALEEMAGIGTRANGHGPSACARCRPVLDELAALRGLGLVPPAAAPWWLHRLLAEAGARAPMLADVSSRAAPAILALGIAITTIISGQPPASAIDGPARRVERARPAATVVERAPKQGARAGSDARDATAPERRATRTDTHTVAGGGPAHVRQGDDGTTTGEVSDGEGDPQGGVIVCQPLQPCPPPPSPAP